MRLTADAARGAFLASPVARLATINPDGAPHLIPITFAGCGDPVHALVFAFDHKPKSGKPLRRIENIAARPAVCLLVDEWSDDWDRLWWVRADGAGEVLEDSDARREVGLDALASKYRQYREVRPAGPVVWIEIHEWSGWAAQSG